MGWREVLEVQTVLLDSLRSFMGRSGFLELLPVVVAPATDPLWPDPSSSSPRPVEFRYAGSRMFVTQSMILHKMAAVGMGLDRVFVLSPNVRLEDGSRASTGRHLVEFVQLDFEVAGASMWDIMELVEDIVVHAIRSVRSRAADALASLGTWPEVPKRPFDRLTLQEAEREFGENWEERLSESSSEPIWVTGIPREFYDLEDPPGNFRNYDLIWPLGHGEALSGGEREWRPWRILEKVRGRAAEVVGPFLELAKSGALRPSAGAGLGIERFLKFVLDAERVEDVRLFARVPGVVPGL